MQVTRMCWEGLERWGIGDCEFRQYLEKLEWEEERERMTAGEEVRWMDDLFFLMGELSSQFIDLASLRIWIQVKYNNFPNIHGDMWQQQSRNQNVISLKGDLYLEALDQRMNISRRKKEWGEGWGAVGGAEVSSERMNSVTGTWEEKLVIPGESPDVMSKESATS